MTDSYAEQLRQNRAEKDQFFAEHPQSPIPPEERNTFSCPLPPEENWLETAIEAGERTD